MDYRAFENQYYIRLDKGEEIISALSSLCEKEGIKAASVQGIGGCEKATVGVFDMEDKTYLKEEIRAMLELISLTGNVTVYEDKPYLHLHASFAYHDENGSAQTLSGHLLEAVIGLTGEIVLTASDIPIGRKYIEDLGIRIWDFDRKSDESRV